MRRSGLIQLFVNTSPVPPGPVPGQVGGERRADDVGHGHGAEPGPALRRAELGDAVAGVEELAVDPDGAAEEVDVARTTDGISGGPLS